MNKIQLIKDVRLETGLDLHAARDLVEPFWAQIVEARKNPIIPLDQIAAITANRYELASYEPGYDLTDLLGQVKAVIQRYEALTEVTL